MELCLAENTAEELMNVQLTRGTMSSENFTQVIKMGVRNGITVECRLIDLLSCIRSPQYIAMPVISIKQPLGDFAESHEEKSAEQQEPLLEIKRPPLYEKVRCLMAIFPTLTHQAVCGSRERQSSIMI